MAHVLQQLYDSEINFSLDAFWNAGFKWQLGVPLSGIVAYGYAETFDEACKALEGAVREHYPESKFANGRGGVEVRDNVVRPLWPWRRRS